MNLGHISQSYNVPATLGRRVVYSGGKNPKGGVITGSSGMRVLIKLDGEKHAKRYHPTRNLQYEGDSK